MHHCASNASYTSQWWWVYCVAPMRVEICESNCSNFPWCHRRVLPLCLGTLLLRCSQKLWKAVVWVLQQSYLGQCRTRLVSPKAYDMQLNGHQVYFQGTEGSVGLGVDHSCTLRVAVTVQLQVCIKLVVGQGVSMWWWSQKSCHPLGFAACGSSWAVNEVLSHCWGVSGSSDVLLEIGCHLVRAMRATFCWGENFESRTTRD